MGMEFPMGMEIQWDSHGNETKNLISHGNGNHVEWEKLHCVNLEGTGMMCIIQNGREWQWE